MHRLAALVLFVSLAHAAPALAQPARPGAQVRLALATYVALGYDNGRGFVPEITNPVDILPEEKLALNAIRDELERWGRYVITPRPSQAELLIAVRKGRLVSVGSGVGRGQGGGMAPPGGTVTESWGVGGALSSPEDMLEVFDSDGQQLWREMTAGGLNGNPPPLFESFRKDVELLDRTHGKKKDEEPDEEPAEPEER